MAARAPAAVAEAVQASLAEKALATINSDATTNRDDSETGVMVAVRNSVAETEAVPVSLAATKTVRASL